MGNRKALASGRWGWIAGLTFLALLAMPIATSAAVEVGSGDDILIFVAHPDDDIITAAGVAMDHVDNGTGDVTIAFMTNGDRCESESQVDAGRCSSLQPGIGTTRQIESVAAQEILGVAASDVIFLGYPNGFVDLVRFNNQGAFPVLAHTETYASNGLGGTDWHDYRMGSGSQHVAYPSSTMAQDLLADVVALVSTYKPDHIFTHTRWDRHEDHFSTYYMLIDAVKVVQEADSSYDPYIHTAIVHVKHADHINLWPATANPATPVNEYVELEGDSGGELVWDQRESFEVPVSMQTGYWSGNNEKAEAIEAHSSQVADGGYFIRRFAHQDEVFWVERLGEAEGIADAYTVVEGSDLEIGSSGVLSNDVRGIAPVGNAPGATPDPLGPMAAELVTGPSHADAFLLNSDGSFSYTHDDTETTSDSFVYRPVQGSIDGITTTVTITVDPENDAPVANPDSYEVDRGELITVPAAGVLGNDSDPEGDPLAAVEVSGPSRGTLDLDSNGSFSYTHDGSATTSDSFTYKASDGEFDSAPVTVSIAVNGSDPLTVNVEGASTGVTGVGYSFSATVSGGIGSKSYLWQAKLDGAVVDSEVASIFTFSSDDAGKYRIELTVTDDTESVADFLDLTLMSDIGPSPFVSDIIWLADEGITQGCNPPQNDMFCPNDRVTRGQMAAFLVRFLGLSEIDPNVAFGDIDGSVFETNILKLATAGITRGCNPPANDMFCPNDHVTRGQMAAFLVRALGLTDNGGGDLFLDDDGSVFEANIDRLATAGITRGCNAAGDEFCPNSFVTRGQMAAFLHRADGLSG